MRIANSRHEPSMNLKMTKPLKIKRANFSFTERGSFNRTITV